MNKKILTIFVLAIMLATMGGANAEEYVIYDDFSDGDWTQNPTWTVLGGAGFQIMDGALSYSSRYGDGGYIQLDSDVAYGTWEYRTKVDGSNGHYEFRNMRFIVQDSNNYIYLQMGETYNGNIWGIMKVVDGQWSAVKTLHTHINNYAWTDVKITRDFNDEINVYANGVLILTTTDSTFTSSNNLMWNAQSNYNRKYMDDLRVTQHAEPNIGDANKGHGNDASGVDSDNPGKGCENKNTNGNQKRC